MLRFLEDVVARISNKKKTTEHFKTVAAAQEQQLVLYAAVLP